jgi:hypothetical protein
MKIKRYGLFLKTILPENVDAITLFPFGIYTRYSFVGFRTTRHETIHWQQQKELFCIGFYLWYLLEWAVKGFNYWKICFEREAYMNDNNAGYLHGRRKYSFLKYVKG